MENCDNELSEKISEIHDHVMKIFEDFAKSYLASEFMSGKDLEWCVKNIQLNQKPIHQEGKIGYKYWFSLRLEEYGADFVEIRSKNKNVKLIEQDFLNIIKNISESQCIELHHKLSLLEEKVLAHEDKDDQRKH
jgi:hypothetical protein